MSPMPPHLKHDLAGTMGSSLGSGLTPRGTSFKDRQAPRTTRDDTYSLGDQVYAVHSQNVVW